MLSLKGTGWIFTKLFTQIRKNFYKFRPWYLEFFNTKSAFLKQISLEVDITCIISSKIPIFYVKLVLESSYENFKNLRKKVL